MAFKWGIASAGLIANDFVAALRLSSEDEHQVVAVAARSIERAEKFAKKFNISRAYGSYKELAEDEEVDIVYVGVINPEHHPVAKLMLEHGQNVLCEKPLCLNHDQASELISLAQQQRVFLMEGIWCRCNPIYERLRQELAANTIGRIRQVIVRFGIAPRAFRKRLRSLGGGGALDIGIYGLQFSTLVFGNVEPTDVQIMGALNDDGIDEYATISLKFGEKQMSTILYSVSSKFENSAQVFGTEGTIKICEPFYSPTEMLINDKPFKIKLPRSSYQMHFENSEAFKFEQDYVKQCVNDGLLEAPLIPHSESLLWMKLTDKIRKELGVKYDQE